MSKGLVIFNGTNKYESQTIIKAHIYKREATIKGQINIEGKKLYGHK